MCWCWSFLGFFFHFIIQNRDEVISVFRNYRRSAAQCHTVKYLPWGKQNVAWCLLFQPLKVPVFCSCCFLEVSFLLLFLSLSQSSCSKQCYIVTWKEEDKHNSEYKNNYCPQRRVEYLEIECLHMPVILSVVWTNYSFQDEMMKLNLDSIRIIKT